VKPFLILQLRPEDEAAEDEFQAFLDKGGLSTDEVRRVRLDQECLPEQLDLSPFSGVIVGGGPGCVSDPPARKSAIEARIEAEILGLMPQVTAQDIPFLGCCYGIGILGEHLGAEVSKARYGEPVGPTGCIVTETARADPLLNGLPHEFQAFVGHKEALQELPAGCVHLVQSGPCPYQMVRYGQNVYATQFHPEADSAVFELRIRVYRNRGYFAPEEADKLVDMCRNADVHAPEKILKNFVRRYRAD